MAKERGIIFCQALMPAVLAHRKTVTRRCHRQQMYHIGDILYLREKHRFLCRSHLGVHVEYAAGPDSAVCSAPNEWEPKHWDPFYNGHKSWCSARYMPKWAARPERFEVISARAEKLQEISPSDCRREGLASTEQWVLLDQFKELWDSLNGKRSEWAWEKNPWVWRYEWQPVGALYGS